MILILMLFCAAPVAILLTAYVKVLYEWFRKVDIDQAGNFRESVSYAASVKSKSKMVSELVATKHIKQAPGPVPWPVLGNLALLAKFDNPFVAFTNLSQVYGDAFSLTLGSTRCIVLNNLELITEALSRNGKYFGDRPDFLRFHLLFGGDRNNSLALCDWSTLQQKRRNLARRHCSPRDTSDFYRKMSDVGVVEMHEYRQVLREKVGAGNEIQLKPILQATAANLFIQYMCSRRFDHEDAGFQHVVNLFDNIFWYINEGYAIDFLPWLSPFYKKHLHKITGWSSQIRDFINKRIVNDREQNLQAEDAEQDFTDALLKQLAGDESVSRDTIMYMLEDFIGGHSAVGNLAMIALSYVALYPEVGRCIQEELDQVTDNGKREVTLLDKDKLPYTVALMFETLRYSSSPILPHVATEDVILSNYAVTKGTVVFINNHKLNTSTEHWTDPEVFRPSRFLDEIVDDNNNGPESGPRYRLRTNMPHFLPFSTGKRTCIGQNLVRSFGFVMIANTLQSYDVSSKSPEDIKLYKACLALPPNTFPLTLTPRKAAQH